MKTKSSKKKSRVLAKFTPLSRFLARLKTGGYSQRGCRIALTRMTNDRTFNPAEAKTAERAYKKAFG